MEKIGYLAKGTHKILKREKIFLEKKMLKKNIFQFIPDILKLGFKEAWEKQHNISRLIYIFLTIFLFIKLFEILGIWVWLILTPIIINTVQGGWLQNYQEKMELLNLTKSKFLFFFFPKTIAGDIGRVILGSFIFLTILVSVGFVLIILAMIFYGTTPRAGLFIMLVIIGGGIYVIIPFILLLAFYFFVRRFRILLKS